MAIETIKLESIDPYVISAIREVKRKSEDYNLLKAVIEKDGQRHPITIRRLTNEEKNSAKESAIYGIIDGHHRYLIAQELGKTEILAMIEEGEVSEIRDIILAFQLNNSNIRMTVIEKGKVISDLIALYAKCGVKKAANEVGKEVFGLETAMAYRCLQEYNKSLGIVPENWIPKKNKFNVKKLSAAVLSLPRTKKASQPETVKECVDILNIIRETERQLRYYKALLFERDGVRETYKAQKNNSNNADNESDEDEE